MEYPKLIAAHVTLPTSLHQDDAAKYGFNIDEADKLRKRVQSSEKLSIFSKVYPGSDEIGFTLLSKFTVDQLGSSNPPLVQVIYRNDSTIDYIPRYEGLPMNETLLYQLEAAGGIKWNSSISTKPQATLLVNNFQIQPQTEAHHQNTSGRSTDDYDKFLPYICPEHTLSEGSSITTTPTVGFVDNRYSNGADIVFIEFIRDLSNNSQCRSPLYPSYSGLDMRRFAYAGWNTDGNTLGCSIANTILLSFFGTRTEEEVSQRQQPLLNSPMPVGQQINCTGACANTYFTTLRMVEDCYYQAILRDQLKLYIDQVNNETWLSLYTDLPFYERYSYKVLASRTEDIASEFLLPWRLASVYYPWNRTFEIAPIAVNASS